MFCKHPLKKVPACLNSEPQISEKSDPDPHQSEKEASGSVSAFKVMRIHADLGADETIQTETPGPATGSVVERNYFYGSGSSSDF
jgi:hypothetical protein